MKPPPLSYTFSPVHYSLIILLFDLYNLDTDSIFKKYIIEREFLVLQVTLPMINTVTYLVTIDGFWIHERIYCTL